MGELYNKIILKPDSECSRQELQSKFYMACEANDYDNMPVYEKAFGNPNKWLIIIYNTFFFILILILNQI